MSEDLEIIRRILLILNQDMFIWHYDHTNKYYMKSGYKVFMKCKICEASSSIYLMGKIWGNLWKLKVLAKIKHFCQKAINESLSTNLNLKNRGNDISVLCCICSNHSESTYHSTFGCIQARDIWKLTFNKVYLDEDFNNSFVDRWLKNNFDSSLADLELVAITNWSIWNDRNKVVHGEEIPHVNV